MKELSLLTFLDFKKRSFVKENNKPLKPLKLQQNKILSQIYINEDLRKFRMQIQSCLGYRLKSFSL